MAKKTITEYESAKNTVTKIQCGGCDAKWEDRSIRGKQGVKTVVLDAKVQRRRSHGGWKSESNKKWNGTSVIGNRSVRFTGEAVEDFCDDCWQTHFPDTAFVEVEESEYYVEEMEREEYFCDFCEDGMGDEPEHIVSLNPHITIEEKIGSASAFSEVSKKTATRAPDNEVSCARNDRMYAQREDSYDCCKKCANDIFNLDLFDSSGGGSKSLLAGIKKAFFGV
jgi:hypothetical protein